MNVQLAIVVVAAIISVIYVVRRVINEWRNTHRDGCNSCPTTKNRPLK